MKKILFFLVVGLSMLTAQAQYSNFSSDSRFGDDISIGFEGGAQTNLHNWKNSHGGIFGLNLNKDLSPYFGLSLEALMGGDNITDWFPKDFDIKGNGGVDNLTGFLTGRWNVMNTFGGFKGYRRIFEIETNVGAGIGRFYSHRFNKSYWNAFQFKTGLNLNFYVNEAKSLAINLRPAIIWNLSETGQFDSRYAVAQLSLGLTYHFKTSNGTHYFVKSDVAQLKDELAALTAVNMNLQDQWANRPIVEKEIIVEKVVNNVNTKDINELVEKTFLVNFAWDSSQLVESAKNELDKIPSGTSVTVSGYASPEGNAEYNLKLSQRRADAVRNYLENRGVKVTQTIGYGADNKEANRIVIINVN